MDNLIREAKATLVRLVNSGELTEEDKHNLIFAIGVLAEVEDRELVGRF